MNLTSPAGWNQARREAGGDTSTRRAAFSEGIAMTPPISPLTAEQREAVDRYRDALFDITLKMLTTYQRALESKGIPSERIAGPLLGALYGAAEEYMRLGGAEEFAARLHNAVQAAATELHFEITAIN